MRDQSQGVGCDLNQRGGMRDQSQGVGCDLNQRGGMRDLNQRGGMRDQSQGVGCDLSQGVKRLLACTAREGAEEGRVNRWKRRQQCNT